MFIYILDKSCKTLSVLLGGLWEEKNSFVLVVQNVHWKLSSKPPH